MDGWMKGGRPPADRSLRFTGLESSREGRHLIRASENNLQGSEGLTRRAKESRGVAGKEPHGGTAPRGTMSGSRAQAPGAPRAGTRETGPGKRGRSQLVRSCGDPPLPVGF